MVSQDDTFCNLQKMLLSGNEISLAGASNFEIPFPFRGKGPTNLICFLTSISHLADGQSEGCAVKRSLFTHFFFRSGANWIWHMYENRYIFRLQADKNMPACVGSYVIKTPEVIGPNHLGMVKQDRFIFMKWTNVRMCEKHLKKIVKTEVKYPASNLQA